MNKHEFERGQTLPFIAVTVLLLVAVAGFASDIGYHQYQQRMQQTATDSAALAAAGELLVNGDYQTAGKRDAATNGFTDGSGSVVVTVGSPGPSDAYASNSHAVEADIKNTYPTFFEKLFNIQSVDVTTKAVAIANAPSKWCIVALDTTGTSSINAHSTVDAPNCDMAINNAHFSVGGQSTLYTADPIQYSGSLTGAGTSTFSPSAPVQALPAADPCPQIDSCLYLQQHPPSTANCQTFTPGTSGPGTYCDMNFPGGTTTLQDGLYVVTGKFNAGNATVNGQNITIVDTNTKDITANNATFNLSAPTSGNYAGMVFYAPNYTQPVTFNSGSGGFDGVIYMPKANLTMNAGATLQAIIITGQLSLNSANTTFAPPPGITIDYPRLVE